MVGVLIRSDKEAHSAAAARGVPRLHRRGGSIGADEGLVPCLAACVTLQGGCDAEGGAALVSADAALACPRPDVPAAGGDFSVKLADGCRAGTVAEIEDRGEPARILVVRSFLGADMGARPAVLAAGRVPWLATCALIAGCRSPPASKASGRQDRSSVRVTV